MSASTMNAGTGPDVRDVIADLWGRATATGPAPDHAVVGVVAFAVALLVAAPPTGRVLRHGITIVHEAGHGFAATLTGRRLSGIRLHSDTSGVTVSVGRPRGAGMVATLLAGYPAASMLGLAAAWAVGAGHAAATLWGLLVVLVLVLLQIRNWFGLWSLAVAGAVVASATLLAPPEVQGTAALAVSMLLLIGGLRTALELQGARRRDRRGGSDADQLARITPLPGLAWVVTFVTVDALCLVGALWLLGPLQRLATLGG